MQRSVTDILSLRATRPKESSKGVTDRTPPQNSLQRQPQLRNCPKCIQDSARIHAKYDITAGKYPVHKDTFVGLIDIDRSNSACEHAPCVLFQTILSSLTRTEPTGIPPSLKPNFAPTMTTFMKRRKTSPSFMPSTVTNFANVNPSHTATMHLSGFSMLIARSRLSQIGHELFSEEYAPLRLCGKHVSEHHERGVVQRACSERVAC